MATVVTFNGVNYSIPAANEEDWQSLSNYLIALASGTQTTNGQKVAVRVSTTATTTVATTDCILLINVAGAATVNLPVGVEKQIFYIADLSGAAATNNITINRAGGNTILGGTSYVMNLNAQIVGLVFTGGNWYRFSESFPTSLVGPTSAVDNGVALFNGTSGRVIKDLGVGTANQVLTTNGTTPSFALIANANVDASAAIAYSKLALTGSIVNADISASAAIAYSKLALTGSIVNADISASAAIAYSKLALSNSIVNNDINTSAAIAYSKLNLSNSIVNNDINSSAAIAYSKLNLSGSIVNADINAGAAIAYSKLALTGSIVDADVATGAAIARSKIAAGTASHVVVNDGSGNLSSVATLPVSQGGTGLNALGSALQLLRVNAGATGLEFATISGVGDVSGPSSSVTNGIAQFASTTGKALKDLGVGLANQVLLTDGTTPSFGAITNAYIDPGAAIALSKLAALTIDRALISNGSGVIAVSSVTSTELGYLSGVTSAIQTQFSGKVGTTGDETIAGSKTFSSAVAITATTNQLILGTTNTATISASAPAASRVYTIADPGQNASFVMDRGTQTLQGIYTFTQQTMTQNVGPTAAAWYSIQSSGTNPQLYNEFQSTAQTWRVGLNVDGLNLGSYVIQDFTATITRAAITTGGQLQLPATSNQLRFGTTNTVTISSTAPSASRVYTIPDAGGAADFILSAGTQTVGGSKTFSSAVTINPASNQIVLSSGVSQITINSGTSAAARTYTIPDAGITADFVMNAGTQTIAGSKTFSSAVTINSASNQVILSSGVNQLTFNSGTSAAARTYTVPDTGTTDTFAMLGGAQTFTALKTFNSGLAIAGGAAANNTIWVASNILNIRGGTSGTDIYNSSGTVVVDITDAGVVTLGPANSSLVHITNGSGLSVRNNGASGGYVDGRQSGTAQWFVGKHSYNVFSGSSFGIGAVVAGLGVEFAAGNAIAGSISAAGAWTLGPSSGAVAHVIRGGGNNNVNIQSTDGTGSAGLTFSPNSTARITIGVASGGTSFIVGSGAFVASTLFAVRANSQIEVTTTNWGTGGTAVGVSAGLLTTSPSSRRYKENETTLAIDSSKIYDIVVKEFDYKEEKGGAHDFGPIAEEVEQILPEIVWKEDGQPESIRELKMVWLLLEEMKKLKAKNDELEAKLDALKAS